ncbi:MAG: hypothetical protein K8L97_13705 [Anaerolineae bacterium]|nr:hypothetical protein [Anaerolineae bacterium]
MKPIQRLLLVFSVSILFSGAALAQNTLNYRLTGTFGGRFIHGGFNTDETIFFTVDSRSLSFYDLTSPSSEAVYTLELTLVRTAADNSEIIAIAQVADSIGYKISLIDIASRATLHTSFIETDGILESLVFSPDNAYLAALVTDSPADEILLFVESAENPRWQVDAVSHSDRSAWELTWTVDSHFVAAELNTGSDYLVFDTTIPAVITIQGAEIYANPTTYPNTLITILKAMNQETRGYLTPAALMTSQTGRYQARYLEYGIGNISLVDTAHPADPPRQLAQIFLDDINDLAVWDDVLHIDFPVGEMHCQIRVNVTYLEEQFNIEPLKHYLGCVHGYLGEYLSAFYAASPTSERFEGRFAEASPYGIVLVRVDEMGLLSEKPEDQLLLDGHTDRVVYSDLMDNNHFLTVSQDQTARIWSIREGEQRLELEDVQVVELNIVPTGMLSYIADGLLAIEDQADQLHLFDFKLDSPSFGKRLQTLPSVGAGFWWIVPASEGVFYTLTSDNAIRRWQND